MKKLNIGCGKKLLDGFINIDINDFGQEIKSDVFIYLKDLIDKKESVDHIRAEHFLEHFNQDEARELLNLMWQVVKSSGDILIVVPHKKDDYAWILAHKTFYCENTFKILEKSEWREVYGFRPWKIKELVVNDRPDIHCVMSPIK